MSRVVHIDLIAALESARGHVEPSATERSTEALRAGAGGTSGHWRREDYSDPLALLAAVGSQLRHSLCTTTSVGTLRH